jgi:sugar-specific transcriptional regulator TrmB
LAEIDITSLLLAAAIATAFSAIVNIGFTRLWRSDLKKYEEWIGPSSLIVETYSSRLRHLESAVIELRSRLDLIETRLPSVSSQTKGLREANVTSQVSEVKGYIKELRRNKKGSPVMVSPPNDNTRKKILRALLEGPKSSSQLVAISGRSREHTLRLLKAMTEKGLINRSQGRPYTYSITEKGREFI